MVVSANNIQLWKVTLGISSDLDRYWRAEMFYTKDKDLMCLMSDVSCVVTEGYLTCCVASA